VQNTLPRVVALLVLAGSTLGVATGPAGAAPRAVQRLCTTSSTGHVCVGVSVGTSLGSETHPASGFLHGITAGTSTSAITALHPTSWRIQAANPAQLPALSTGASVQMILSDAWWGHTYTSSRGTAASPWSDWTAYTAWVKQTVTAAEQAGAAPAYWDIQNEPETKPYYDPAAPATTALVLQQYAAAYRAIKAVDPKAKVLGPSIDWAFTDPTFPVDMVRFLDYAVAQGLRFDALSWHENGDSISTDTRPEAIPAHVALVRQYLSGHPTLGNPPLILNEYGGSHTGLLPGWLVAYFSALDGSGAALAGHSCWGNCFVTPGTLDGLLTADGATPTAPYWVYQRYAGMTGQRVSVVTTNGTVSAVAVRSADGTARMLIGRDETCAWWVAGAPCPRPADESPQPVDLEVGGLPAGSVRINTAVIPASAGAVNGPSDVGTSDVAVVGGTAQLSLPALGVGAAFSVTVTPIAVATPAAAGAAPVPVDTGPGATIPVETARVASAPPVTVTPWSAPSSPAPGAATAAKPGAKRTTGASCGRAASTKRARSAKHVRPCAAKHRPAVVRRPSKASATRTTCASSASATPASGSRSAPVRHDRGDPGPHGHAHPARSLWSS
jgi:hypothetical protein